MHIKSISDALKGRNDFEDLGIDDRILKWIFKIGCRAQGIGQ